MDQQEHVCEAREYWYHILWLQAFPNLAGSTALPSVLQQLMTANSAVQAQQADSRQAAATYLPVQNFSGVHQIPLPLVWVALVPTSKMTGWPWPLQMAA